MEKLTDILTKIDELQSEINSHGELNAELAKKIQYKFRLDWNYFSNAMEGNSLTRIETKQLMMDNVTIDGKSFKDISEMRGHDEIVQEIFKVGKGDARISEKRIKEMHKAIMHEDDPEKRGFIGKWKVSNNHLINYRGEKFDFLEYSEVPDAMHQLINKTNADIDALKSDKKGHKHPVLIASEFHLDYVRIHPFYDGNGRTARLLTNLLLISFGYPPFLLSEKSRDSYNRILAEIQGYGGDRKDFHVLIGSLLIESQKLVLDAIAGKDISDEDDVDKEILLWKQGLDSEEIELLERSSRNVALAYENSIRPVLELFIEKHRNFSDLFNDTYVVCYVNDGVQHKDGLKFLDDLMKYHLSLSELDDEDQNSFAVMERMAELSVKFNREITNIEYIRNIRIRINFFGFRRRVKNPFDISTQIVVEFDQYRYGLLLDDDRMDKLKLYSEKYSEKEVKEIVNKRTKNFFEKLKVRAESGFSL